MRITYHQDVDILRILLSDSDIEESDEHKPGVIIDYDGQGNVVGMEILDASSTVSRWFRHIQTCPCPWIPAFAGMTIGHLTMSSSRGRGTRCVENPRAIEYAVTG